jgi:hypothetical protein
MSRILNCILPQDLHVDGVFLHTASIENRWSMSTVPDGNAIQLLLCDSHVVQAACCGGQTKNELVQPPLMLWMLEMRWLNSAHLIQNGWPSIALFAFRLY